MASIEEDLQANLDARKAQGMLRQLSSENTLVDFASNDYLGLAGEVELELQLKLSKNTEIESFKTGSGSRLISGNCKALEQLESFIASYHQASSGLIFNSGYDANLGLFQAVPQRGETIIYDSLVHASIRDGIRLSNAQSWRFNHNDVQDLQKKLENAQGRCYVVVESVYSMDGDVAPLSELVSLCKVWGASLIVDEAHATGTFGPKGEGKVVELGLQASVFARIHTFGKALGSHGAIVLGSEVLRQYLINFARPFIYTTAMTALQQMSIKIAYDKMSVSCDKIFVVRELSNLFNVLVEGAGLKGLIPGNTPIRCVVIPGNDRVKRVAQQLQKTGYDVRPILSPTVPKGQERLRFCLHAYNTEEEIRGAIRALQEALEHE